MKRFAFTGICCFLLLGGWASRSIAQDSLLTFKHPEQPPTMQELLEWKEVFTYEVIYGFFKLGQVQTTIIRDTTFQGQQVWWLQTVIKSNSEIPFVGDEENRYNTFFVTADSQPYTRLYWRDNIDEKQFNSERYRFDYESEKLYISEKGEPVDTLALTEPSTSGQLIFYYGRLFAGTSRDFRLPVYLSKEKGYIHTTNTTKIEKREYDAFDEPVKTYYSEGNADIDGPFGFSGAYKAWNIADDLRVPAEAHAEVWLGNVKVRLINYNKERR